MAMAAYVRNLWYMAAWEEEVVGDALLDRTLLDLPWVLFRKREGDSYAMLLDRCPHRLAPLHRGTRAGDTIACPYHGLEFDSAGRCTRNPFSARIPPHAQVDAPPVVARYGAIWFWPGNPALADPATIPDFSVLDAPVPVVTRGKTRFEANYEIVADNLLDLSHIEFIHRESFQPEGKIFAGQHRAEETDDGAIWSKWTMNDRPAPARFDHLPAGTRIDEWLDMRWHAPASMLLHIGFTLAGRPRDAAPQPPMINPHIITPETAKTSHYFYTRHPGEESAAHACQVFEQEDRPMLEAIQRRMGDRGFWDWNPVVLNVDAAAIRARRRLMKLRRNEAGEADAAVA
jgi:vanillate O-demethylase monooxygenase subunit